MSVSKISAGLRQMAKNADALGSWSTEKVQHERFMGEFRTDPKYDFNFTLARQREAQEKLRLSELEDAAEKRRIEQEDKAEFLASPNANSW